MLTEGGFCLAMKKIEELGWKDFRLLDLFTYQKGNQKNMNSLIGGEIPLVSAKKIENGYKGFYRVNEKEIYKGDCITLNNDGDGGAGLAFYQPSSFALDTHVTALYPIEKMSKNTMLFIACCISRQSVLFGHGHSINTPRLNHLTIMLPCDDSGQYPNYEYMDNYMKQIEKKLLVRYKNYLNNAKLNSQTSNSKKEIRWKDFFIEDVCNIMSGQDIYNRERKEGDIPYVTATALQNGIGYFVGNINETLESGCLSINRNGSVGYCFYHPYKALYGNDTRKLVPIVKDKYTSLFLSSVITKQKDKYGYGLKMGTERLKRQKIMLPVDDKDKPDWKYMRDCMRAKEQALLLNYINYIDSNNTNNDNKQ